jgi:lipoic acid synthetase
MILGDTCTRRCGFCNVQTGKPTHNDPLEPLRVAQSVKKMGLRHAVVTSVDRDDLPDLGSRAFVGTIRSIRKLSPGTKVEVLTPDFRGQEMPLARVIAERPDVFNHNVETVPRLYPLARRGSKFLRSCRVLANAKQMGGDEVVTKSGLMTGLGETMEELVETFGVLREHDVQVLTVGQYLRPTENHLPCATGIPTSSPSSSARPTRWASSRWPPVRSCARATTPSRPSSRPLRAPREAAR